MILHSFLYHKKVSFLFDPYIIVSYTLYNEAECLAKWYLTLHLTFHILLNVFTAHAPCAIGRGQIFYPTLLTWLTMILIYSVFTFEDYWLTRPLRWLPDHHPILLWIYLYTSLVCTALWLVTRHIAYECYFGSSWWVQFVLQNYSLTNCRIIFKIGKIWQRLIVLFTSKMVWQGWFTSYQTSSESHTKQIRLIFLFFILAFPLDREITPINFNES